MDYPALALSAAQRRGTVLYSTPHVKKLSNNFLASAGTAGYGGFVDFKNVKGLYVLNRDGVPVPEPDLERWGSWFGRSAKIRRVARTKVGRSVVSTVFLAVDHGWLGTPILWETMIFGGPLNNYQDRCSGSREQAEAMHAKAVMEVRKHSLLGRLKNWMRDK